MTSPVPVNDFLVGTTSASGGRGANFGWLSLPVIAISIVLAPAIILGYVLVWLVLSVIDLSRWVAAKRKGEEYTGP